MQPLTCTGIVRGMSRATPKTPTKTAKKPRNAATLKALDDLEYVDRYIKRADAECRASMRSIIAKCPEVVKTMTEEEIAWAFQEEVV